MDIFGGHMILLTTEGMVTRAQTPQGRSPGLCLQTSPKTSRDASWGWGESTMGKGVVSICCVFNTCYSYGGRESIELTFLNFFQEERPTGILEKLFPEHTEKGIWIVQGGNWDGHGDDVPPGSALRKPLVPQLRLWAVSGWFSAVTPPRDGHSCREVAPPRPCPSWGIPHLTANPGRGMNVQHGATLMVHFGSEIPTRSTEAVVGPLWQLDFPFCTILLPSSPFHR